jgi:hypothetical protein
VKVKGREAAALLRVLRENGHFADSRPEFVNFAFTTCNFEAAEFAPSILRLHPIERALLCSIDSRSVIPKPPDLTGIVMNADAVRQSRLIAMTWFSRNAK